MTEVARDGNGPDGHVPNGHVPDGHVPKVQIWHNPRCSKSRATLALLEERLDADEISIVRYLDDPPDRDRLVEVLAALGRTPGEFIRRGEALFRELDLANADDDTLIDAMVDNPKLIERPLVLRDAAARIARPPESVLEIL